MTLQYTLSYNPSGNSLELIYPDLASNPLSFTLYCDDGTTYTVTVGLDIVLEQIIVVSIIDSNGLEVLKWAPIRDYPTDNARNTLGQNKLWVKRTFNGIQFYSGVSGDEIL